MGNRKNTIPGVGEEIVELALAGSLYAGNFSPGWRYKILTSKREREK